SCGPGTAPAHEAMRLAGAHAALLAWLTCSCGGERPGPAPAAPPEPQAWFAGRMPPLAPWAIDLRARVDPATDGWESEVVAETVERELGSALREALKQGASALAPILAPDFQGLTVLAPKGLDTSFDDGWLCRKECASSESVLHTRAEIQGI